MHITKSNLQKLLLGFSFTFFLLTAVYNLSAYSLNLDEGTEYWYSKELVGKLPQAPGNNMYERILITYQPPLYNFLMFFWLKISNSVWWFRFFGVICGFIGIIGLYKSIVFVANNIFWGIFSILISSCMLRLVYYWQEASEYCLLLASLFWVVYFWIRLVSTPSLKYIILFTITSVIAVCSQYGAVFSVSIMAFTAAIAVFRRNNRKQNIQITISYLAALITAGIPLYFFFLKKQRTGEKGGSKLLLSELFKGISVETIWNSLRNSFRYFFFTQYSEEIITIAAILILLSAVFCLIKGQKILRYLVLTEILTYIPYYLLVTGKVYAYGEFGTRHALFLMPLLLTSGIIGLSDFFGFILRLKWNYQYFKYYSFGIFLCIIFCYSYLGWKVIENHEHIDIENNKSIVNNWINEKGYEENTFVYYGTQKCFSYYIRQTDDFTEEMEKNVYYMPWNADQSESNYEELISNIYKNKPQTIYFAASHIRNDVDTILNAFKDYGYQANTIYNNHGKLIKLTRK